MPQLSRIYVQGLLDQFDHEIKFPSDWEFVILHGPNGVGKTKLLELIEATFAGRFFQLSRAPFESATFDFDDGSRLELTKPGQGTLFDQPGIEDGLAPVKISLHSHGETHSRTMPAGPPDRAAERRLVNMLRHSTRYSQVGPARWRDRATGEVLSTYEIADRQPWIQQSLLDDLSESDAADPIATFLTSVTTYLIETQRLINLDRAGESSRRPDEQSHLEKVTQYSLDLVKKFREALAENSRTSQDLDQTFPQRILHGRKTPAVASEQRIRKRYAEQSALRERLAEVNLLDTSGELNLPARNLEDWERRVLWQYLNDAEKKLATFQTLLDRVQLLKDIVNSRFLYKEMMIDREHGFRFTTKTGKEIGAAELSSGEQHELVLIYNLLFNVQEGSLVLIDEPEISLHVAWQQQFLSDIAQISQLSSLRFVIATHSPQIIHKWWARAVPLGPGVDGEVAQDA